MPAAVVTETLRQALARSISVAQSGRSPEITPEIILASILADNASPATKVLNGLGLHYADVRKALASSNRRTSPPNPPFSTEAGLLLQQAIANAHQQGCKRAGTTHTIASVIDKPPPSLVPILAKTQATPDRIDLAFHDLTDPE